MSVKYKQCIIIVERRFTADRSPKAVDGNFVERDAKRRAFIVTLIGLFLVRTISCYPFLYMYALVLLSALSLYLLLSENISNAVTISRDFLLTQEMPVNDTYRSLSDA